MLKKKIGRLTLVVLVATGCAGESSRPSLPAPPSPPTVSTPLAENKPPMTWSDSIEAIEVAGIRAADGKVTRAGPELRIQLLSGPSVVFEDDTTRLSVKPVARYAGYLKRIHSHVVHMVPYEGSGWYVLLDDSTGDSTTVAGMPIPSPDGTRFAWTSMPDEGKDGAIEVWRMESLNCSKLLPKCVVERKPDKEFSYDLENAHWLPSDAVWRDSVTIDFIKNSGDDPHKPFIKTPGRLTRTGTTWVLADSPL